MNKEEFSKLERGDIVQNTGSGKSFVIENKIGQDQYIGVDTCVITNPAEWEKHPIILKPQFKEGDLVKVKSLNKIGIVDGLGKKDIQIRSDTPSLIQVPYSDVVRVQEILKPHTFETAVKALAEHGFELKTNPGFPRRVYGFREDGAILWVDVSGTSGVSTPNVLDHWYHKDDTPFAQITYKEYPV